MHEEWRGGLEPARAETTSTTSPNATLAHYSPVGREAKVVQCGTGRWAAGQVGAQKEQSELGVITVGRGTVQLSPFHNSDNEVCKKAVGGTLMDAFSRSSA